MKKMPKVKINVAEFFTKNIGVLGLVVVIILFSVYMVIQKMNNMDARILQLENGGMMEGSTPNMMEEDKSDVEGDFDVVSEEYDIVEEGQ